MAIKAGHDITASSLLGLKRPFPWGNQWKQCANAPGAVTQGGALVYDGRQYIYAYQGGSSQAFWRYDIFANTWKSDLATTVQESYGALVYDGSDSIYGIPGGTYLGKYSISGNSWTEKSDIPDIVGEGVSMIYDGNNYLYILRGNSTNRFWRYNISGNSWSNMADFPANVYWGAGLIYDGENYIFGTKGNATTEWYRYNISSNSWEQMSPALPTINNTHGSFFVYDNIDYIYWIEGSQYGKFYRFSVFAEDWEQLATPSFVPVNIGNNGIYCQLFNCIFVFKGDNTTTFYKYMIK